jgi:hypothetical protein
MTELHRLERLHHTFHSSNNLLRNGLSQISLCMGSFVIRLPESIQK